MKKVFLLSTAFCCFFAFSCKKENPSPQDKCLDRPRCEGCDWNVFRCKVNGEDWCASCESGDPLFGCDPVDCQFYPSSQSLAISAGNKEGKGGISISVSNSIIKMDSSRLSRVQNIYRLRKYNTLDCYTYDLDDGSKIIEGSFEFTAINTCFDTVHITDGYFKLTYRP